MSPASPRAVLLTGPFGVGKTAVAEEMADLLEGEIAFAAIDLDWLAWYDDGRSEAHGLAATAMLARNLAAVVANYRAAGVELFVLAGSVRDEGDLEAIRGALGMPLTVVRLHAPLDEIEARLAAAPTTGRRDDLRRAREWVAAGEPTGFQDAVVENRGPLRSVAEAVLDAMPPWSNTAQIERSAPVNHGSNQPPDP
jgi:chloramphenicol 3-O-phosphotransferase